MRFWFTSRRKSTFLKIAITKSLMYKYLKIFWLQEHITKLVEYMGGIFTKQLRSRVTHLVTGSVMSAKYEVSAIYSIAKISIIVIIAPFQQAAIDMQIPIFTKEWVEAIWKINLTEYIKADNSMFDKYKAPVFLNLVVTSTNLPKPQKEEIKRLINDNGGVCNIMITE